MKDTFLLVPASSHYTGIAAILLFSLLLMGIAFFALISYSRYTSRRTCFKITEGGLQIDKTGYGYGRFIPRESISISDMATINLHTNKDLSIQGRTNGIGLPGFSYGWFKLSNGEKSLLFVTDRSNIVYIPTTDGYSLMLSVQDPATFSQAMREQYL